MRKPTTLIFSGLILMAQTTTTQIYADPSTYSRSSQNENDASAAQFVETPVTPFTSFTGKVTKNKVRLRLQPNLEGPILKELVQGDMLIIIGETEDFYAVQPPTGSKAYVFRTYILDGVVEASRVNCTFGARSGSSCCCPAPFRRSCPWRCQSAEQQMA